MKKFYLTLILCGLLFTVNAQTWEQSYIADTALQGIGVSLDVVQTQDGGFVMAGEIDLPTGAIRHYIQLIKTDGNGGEQWRKILATYYDVRMDKVSQLYEMPDAGFIIGGSTAYNSQGLYIIRTDQNGDTLWTKTHGTAMTNRVSNYTKTSNFEFLSFARNDSTLTLYRTDTLGNITLQKTLSDFFTPNDVQEMSNGDYIIVGQKNGQIHLVRTDTQGNTLWSASNGFSTADAGVTVQPLPNGDFIVGGYGTGIVGQSAVLTRFDGSGNLVWQNFLTPIAPMAQVSDITLNSAGNCIVTGSVDKHNWYAYQGGGFSAEITPSGQLVWLDTFSTTISADGAAVTMTDDSCFVISGGSQQGYYLRNQCGTTSTLPTLQPNATITVAPNPSSDIIQFDINTDDFQTFDLQLFDVSGQLIRSEKIGKEYRLHRNNLPAGVYFYRLFNDNYRIGNGKIVFVD